MRQFELLPHTGDVAIRVEADSREELMRGAIEGMFAIAEPQRTNPFPSVRRLFRVASADFPSLVVDVMSEALALSDEYHETYTTVEGLRVSDTEAEGELIGAPVRAFATQIKAVTYHDLAVRERDDGMWEARMTFDV